MALSAVGAVLSIALVLGLLAVWSVFGRTLSLPGWAVDHIETRLNARMDEAQIKIDGIGIGLFDRQLSPTFDLRDIEVSAPNGEVLLRLPHLRSTLDTSELLQGRVALETLDLRDARLQLVRDAQGRLAVSLGGAVEGAPIASVKDMLARIDAIFEERATRELEEVSGQNLSISLSDMRTGQMIAVEGGAFHFVNGAHALSLNVNFDLNVEGGPPAAMQFAADKGKGGAGLRLLAKFSDLSTGALAAQVGALNWLSVLDAPVSGALTAEIGADGQLSDLVGGLDIAAGVLRPARQANPVPFNSIGGYVRYAAATQRLTFERITVDAPELRLHGSGHADLRDVEAGIPQTLLGQLRLSDIVLDPGDVFEAPVAFARGAIDLRYRPTALELDIGALVLSRDDIDIVASGQVGVGETGWRAALDASIDAITPQDLLALWPTQAVTKTRSWLLDNISAGSLGNVAAAVRLAQDTPSRQAVTFNFDDATVRFMKTLPPIQNGYGYGAITGTQFLLSLEKGAVTAPDGNRLDVSGSVLEIADMTRKPAALDITLTTRGDLQGALSLLDEKPFEFLSKAKLDPTLATGRASVTTRLNIPLRGKLGPGDIRFDVTGTMEDVKTDTLIPDRTLAAPVLTLAADNTRLSIGGSGTLDGVALEAAWSRALGQGAPRRSAVKGRITLSPKSLDTFGIKLPPGMVSGSGRADLAIAMEDGAPPRLTLTSDLRGVGLGLATLDWAKPRETTGTLRVEAVLGATPGVPVLEVAAQGLVAKGAITLAAGGGFERATFQPLNVADRLNGQVDVVARGPGQPPRLVISGGTIDIRKFGGDGLGEGTGAGGPPIDLALDRLVVTDAITLQNFRASFTNARGLDGSFEASINGAAPVTGTVQPTPRGPSIRITSRDGGAVLRGSGIFRNGRGGALDLQLAATGRPGQFDGQARLTNARVVDAPALAELLSALSVIGLLEQLGGEGILFTNVDADFILGPRGVTLKSASAVGASMGITMDGVFDTNRRVLDMQGVVSPIYAVNGLFGALFAPRRGEGLFGFNYTLKGPADGPNVSVNPLSILTPGVFREIFRQAPPKLQN